MDTTAHLFSLVQSVISIAPALVLIWKMAGYAHQIKDNRRDIDGLGIKVNEAIAKQEKEQSEIINKVTTIGNNMTSIMSSLEYMKRDIDEVKKDVKEWRKNN